MRPRASRFGLLATMLCIAATGCDTIAPSICDRSRDGNPPILFTGGAVADGIYMTSPWDGELLDFPGGARYRLEHGLGRTPRIIESYLSFNSRGTFEEGTLAQSAGNQVLIESVDDQMIEIFNDSCVEYWLLVVASAGVPTSDGAGGGGGEPSGGGGTGGSP